ncbi:hypothetical protein GYB22_09625 [bacterium]|nr:hypothetical protein [bacterium]
MIIQEPVRKSLILAFIYLIFGITWIVLSDFITLNKWFDDPENITQVQTKKGIFFVFISAILVGVLGYFLNFRRLKMIELKEQFVQQLQSELAQKQLLLNSTSDAIVSCDSNGIVKFYNQKFSEWFQPANEFNIEHWPSAYNMYALFEERPLDSAEVCLAIAMEAGHVENYKYRLLNNREERVIEANGSAIIGPDNKPSGALVVLRDISGRLLKEDKNNSIILDAIDKEREGIATEIHDSITQQITSVYYNLISVKARNLVDQNVEGIIDDVTLLLNNTIKDCRNLSRSLIPVSIPEFGLEEALKGLADQYSFKSDLKIDIDYKLETKLSSDAELQLYRIIQQACMNSLTHSECDSIEIELKSDGTTAIISITDNGKGFDIKQTEKAGIGLLTMRNRARSLNGTFDVSSSEGNGTRIEIQIPLK